MFCERWLDSTLKKYFSLYPVIIGGVGVLVTGNNLWCHPVGCTDEGVPAAHCPVQLGTHSEIHWEATKCKMICENKGHGVAPTVTVRHSPDVNIPSLTSAFSVSRTFWPFMSLWMTLWAWRWERPWANTEKSNRGEEEGGGLCCGIYLKWSNSIFSPSGFLCRCKRSSPPSESCPWCF